ncbi:MAG: ABC transporter permease [Ornithinimicrobium sp.]
MGAALDVEWCKLRRSRVIAVITVVVLLAPPALAAAFAWAAGEPGADPLTLKARALLPGPGWEGFVSALGQVFATGGLLGLGVGVAWCFGREYADRTIVSLYASATPRAAMATAKFVVLTAWSLSVAAAVGPVAFVVALLAGLGPPDTAALVGLGRVMALAALTGVLALLVALFATVGKGYLMAFGGLIALITSAQVAVIVGVGPWFPLSSPALWAVHDPAVATVSPGQLAIVPSVAVIVVVATVARWQRATVS